MQNTKIKTRKRADKNQRYLDALIEINYKLFKSGDDGFYSKVLGLLAEATYSDGVYFFEQASLSDEKEFTLKASWRGNSLQAPEAAAVEPDSLPALWLGLLNEGKHISKKISKLKPADKKRFSGSNVLACLAVPIKDESKYYGYLRFDSLSREDNYSASDINFIKSAANLIAISFEHKNSYAKLQTSHHELRNLFYDKINQLEKLSKTIKNNVPHGVSEINQARQSFYFSRFLNNTRDIIYVTDMDGKFLSVNNYVETVTGYKREELVSRNIFDFIMPQYVSIYKKMLEMARAGVLNQANYEVKFSTKSGDIVFFEINNYIVSDKDENPSEVLGIARNITDIKNGESKLLKLKQDFYEVINSSSDALMSFKPIYNDAGKIIDFEWLLLNSAAEKLLDKKSAELVGRSMLSNLNDNSIESLFDRFVHAYESKIPLYYEHNYKYKDIALWLRISAVRHNENLIMNLSDVTFHKQSEKDLQEQINFNEILLDSLPYPALLIDKNRCILAFNKFACEIGAAYKSDAWELFDHHPNCHQKLFHELNKCFFCYAANCLETKSSVKCFEHFHNNRYWQMNLLHVYENIFLFFAIDITENKKMFTRVEYANEKECKTENIKRQFLCNMSHELRTPMNIIIGFSELLSETTLEGEQNEYLRQIKTSSLSLLGIINDIIDFSNIEAERIELANSEFNLNELVQEAVANNLEFCKSKNLDLILKFDPRIDFCVISDPQRLKQILLNLINNAVKFTPEGKIQVCVSLESIPSESGRAFIKFEIIDEGIGIQKDKQADLFSPFMQADASLTRRYGGVGLGLSISNHLVRLLGSNKIFCESEPGKGSNFYFVIDFLKGQPI